MVGTPDITIDNGYNRYCVEKFATHPYHHDFFGDESSMDVAVVKLRRPLNLSDETKIKIVALPEMNAPFIGENIRITVAG